MRPIAPNSYDVSFDGYNLIHLIDFIHATLRGGTGNSSHLKWNCNRCCNLYTAAFNTKTNGISVNIFFTLTFRFARLLMLHPLFHTFYIFFSLSLFFVYFAILVVFPRGLFYVKMFWLSLYTFGTNDFLNIFFFLYKSSGSFDAITE